MNAAGEACRSARQTNSARAALSAGVCQSAAVMKHRAYALRHTALWVGQSAAWQSRLQKQKRRQRPHRIRLPPTEPQCWQ